jgi:hypothetical protein
MSATPKEFTKGKGSGSSAMQEGAPHFLRPCRLEPVGMWGRL